ncbi:hypothetical protein ACLB2K_001182 [Fragaria x ananassa]
MPTTCSTYFHHLFRPLNLHKTLTRHQTRRHSRDPFPNKLSICLKLRTNTPISLTPLANNTLLLDSFFVAQALIEAVNTGRTYMVMIKHMVKCGKLEAAMEVFKVLPFMRVKRSLGQYEVLVEVCAEAKQFEEVNALLEEMWVDGMLPGRAMRLSLEKIREAGFVAESD